MAYVKLSGVAVPSCSWGSSHRVAMPTCHARVILPLGTTLAEPVSGASPATATVPPTRVTRNAAMRKRCKRFLMLDTPLWDAEQGQLFDVNGVIILFKCPKFQCNSWPLTEVLLGTATGRIAKGTLRCSMPLHLITLGAMSATCCRGIFCADASYVILSSSERLARGGPSASGKAPHRASRWTHEPASLHGSGKHEWIH